MLLLALHAALLASAARADSRLGIVFMHGKQSAPNEHAPIAESLAAAGHPVERPEMCWSARRIYDLTYLQCLEEIDAAVERLRRRGATAFVVAGHSLGANGALAYGALAYDSGRQLTGVVALAPGHRPEALARRPAIATALERARELIGQGKAQLEAPFPDVNGDLMVSVTTTPEIYLSFFAPDSPAVMPVNASRLQAPLLYIVGTDDPLQRGPNEIFAKAPPHPLNRYVAVRASHFGTSAAAADTVVAWIRALTAPK